MAKRIKIYKPNGIDTIEIWDNELDKFLAKGYKLSQEKKSTRTSKKKDVEVEEQTETKEYEEWQHTSEQAE
jgi:FtsZ-binding cell division protein ZapB